MVAIWARGSIIRFMEQETGRLFNVLGSNTESFRADLVTYDEHFRSLEVAEVAELIHEYCKPSTEAIVIAYLLGTSRTDIALSYGGTEMDIATIISRAAWHVGAQEYEEGKAPSAKVASSSYLHL